MNVERIAEVMREQEPDEVARARVLAQMSPQLDALAERYAAPRRLRWVPFAFAAAVACAALVWWQVGGGSPAHVVADRDVLRPYVVAGETSQEMARTLLAGRFSTIDVPAGQVVRATVDEARVGLVGPARITVRAATPSTVDVDLESGTLLVASEHGRELRVHTGQRAVIVQSAQFAMERTEESIVVYVERGDVIVDGHAIGAGMWVGAPSAPLVEALRQHARDTDDAGPAWRRAPSGEVVRVPEMKTAAASEANMTAPDMPRAPAVATDTSSSPRVAGASPPPAVANDTSSSPVATEASGVATTSSLPVATDASRSRVVVAKEPVVDSPSPPVATSRPRVVDSSSPPVATQVPPVATSRPRVVDSPSPPVVTSRPRVVDSSSPPVATQVPPVATSRPRVVDSSSPPVATQVPPVATSRPRVVDSPSRPVVATQAPTRTQAPSQPVAPRPSPPAPGAPRPRNQPPAIVDSPPRVVATQAPTRTQTPSPQPVAPRPSPPASVEVVTSPQPVAPPTTDGPAEMYARAESALAAGDRKRAAAILQALVAAYPASTQASTARFDLATLARARGDLAGARAELGRLLAGSPPAALREPASYLDCRLQADAKTDATACFRAFRVAFPHSPHDAEVLAWLAAHAFAAGDCGDARALADEYLRRYPKAVFAARAQEITKCAR